MEVSRIPVEVIENHVLSYLSAADLVSSSMTCKSWRKIASKCRTRALQKQTHHNDRRYSKAAITLLSIYEGSEPLQLLRWFENCLRYPRLASLPEFLRRDCVGAAAEG